MRLIRGRLRKSLGSTSFHSASTDFTLVKKPGDYRIIAGGVTSPVIRIRSNVYAGAADTLLYYMREQRSGFNPLFKTVVHTRDGIVVDDSTRAVFANISATGTSGLQHDLAGAAASLDVLVGLAGTVEGVGRVDVRPHPPGGDTLEHLLHPAKSIETGAVAPTHCGSALSNRAGLVHRRQELPCQALAQFFVGPRTTWTPASGPTTCSPRG